MREYLTHGARLGWLIDPVSKPRKVFVDRPGRKAEELEDPAQVSADPELPGFVLDLTYVWNPEI
jgi:Uma2 family endonuclease